MTATSTSPLLDFLLTAPAVLGRRGKEADPHGVSSILWTHLVREPRRKTIRGEKKKSDGGHLERSEALARRKVSFLQRQGDTDLHASVGSKAVTDACVTELPSHMRPRSIALALALALALAPALALACALALALACALALALALAPALAI